MPLPDRIATMMYNLRRHQREFGSEVELATLARAIIDDDGNDIINADKLISGDIPHARSVLSLVTDVIERVASPSGFNWPFATYPITIRRSLNGYTAEFNAKSFVNASIWTGTAYYVDVATGSDANAGTLITAPKKSIFGAINAGNTTAAPYRIFVLAGRYPRQSGINDTTSAVFPTQPCAIIGYGGRVETGTFDEGVTWGSPDGVFPNTYKVARTSVTKVFDTLLTDVFGNYKELAKVADAATCNSTVGSWAQVGGDLYVRPFNELIPPTLTNTRVILTGEACKVGNFDIYLSGLDVIGGANAGGLRADQTAARNIIIEDCTFRFAGNVSTPRDGATIDNMTGLVACIDSQFDANTKDGLNVHNTVGQTYVLTINCSGRDNGRTGSTSNNGLTLHENAIGIDVGGKYSYNHGGNVRSINTSQHWLLGTLSEHDIGDVVFGGSIKSSAFTVSNTAKMWLDRVTAKGCLYGISADSGSTVYYRNIREIGGARTGDGYIVGY